MRYLIVKENLQQARKILKKYNVEESDPKFQEIRNLIETIFGKNQLGFIGLATKFAYQGRMDINALKDLFTEIKDNKNLLKNLPKQVINYKNPEELIDDLTKAKEWSIYNRMFVQRIKGSFKKDARKDDEMMDSFTAISDDKQKDLLQNFIPKINRYKSYSDFRIAVFNYLSDPIDREEILNKIENTSGIDVYYQDEIILVADVFNFKASCAIGSKSWCISNSLHWWDNYNKTSKGNKQYFIWNFTVPATDINSRVGVTIKPDGSALTAHLKNDRFVYFDKYCERYGIERELFKPMGRKDIPKIIKYIPTDDGLDLAAHLSGDDKQNILMKYKNLIPKHKAMVWGLLTDEEMNEFPKIRKMIYSKDGNKEINRLIINLYDSYSFEEFNEKYPDSAKLIPLISFYDKLNLVRMNPKDFTDLSCEIFFKTEIESCEYPLTFDITGTQVNFMFEMDEDDYVENILGCYIEDYYNIISLEGDTNYFTSFGEGDEYNYLDRHINNENMELLKKYFEILKKYIVHEKIIKEIDEFLEDGNTTNDDWDGFTNMIKKYDPKFNYDDWGENKGYFVNFLEEIEEAASVVVQNDVSEWENGKVGYFEKSFSHYSSSSKSQYTVEIDDILKTINVENIDINKFSINDWIESKPSDINDINFSFYDSPYPGHYLSEADHTEAHKVLKEALQESIDIEIFEDKEDREELLMLAETEKKLLKQGFEPKFSGNWSNKFYYYGKTFEGKGDVVEVEKNSNTKDAIKVKERQNLNYVVTLDNIHYDSYYLYILRKPFSYYNEYNYNNDYRLFKSPKKEMAEMGIEVKYIDLDDYTLDPDQQELDLKFEGIKSFNSFKQSKLR
jgi:hypothetical protein